MWHKAEWMGRPMRLELTRVGLLDYLANRYTTRGAHNGCFIIYNNREKKNKYKERSYDRNDFIRILFENYHVIGTANDV